jgi:hypothetical protein
MNYFVYAESNDEYFEHFLGILLEKVNKANGYSNGNNYALVAFEVSTELTMKMVLINCTLPP